jgi:hypothetical protein
LGPVTDLQEKKMYGAFEREKKNGTRKSGIEMAFVLLSVTVTG